MAFSPSAPSSSDFRCSAVDIATAKDSESSSHCGMDSFYIFLSDSWTAFWKSKNGSWIAWELAKINNNEPILSTLKWTDYHCKLLLIWIFDGKEGSTGAFSPASGTDFMVWQQKHFCRLHLYFFRFKILRHDVEFIEGYQYCVFKIIM